MKRKKKLVCKNGRWYENGKLLHKKDYIYHADCHEGEYIISCITSMKYRIRDAIFI